MGIYFQPDMSNATELSTANTASVLREAFQVEDSFAELRHNGSMDFLCSIKELQPYGSFLKSPPVG
jgi:hypothetical protein